MNVPFWIDRGETLIEESGSLILTHNPGSDREPEQHWITLRDNPSVSGSLAVAFDWMEIGGFQLNGSQVATVKRWAGEYL